MGRGRRELMEERSDVIRMCVVGLSSDTCGNDHGHDHPRQSQLTLKEQRNRKNGQAELKLLRIKIYFNNFPGWANSTVNKRKVQMEPEFHDSKQKLLVLIFFKNSKSTYLCFTKFKKKILLVEINKYAKCQSNISFILDYKEKISCKILLVEIYVAKFQVKKKNCILLTDPIHPFLIFFPAYTLINHIILQI